MAKKCVVINIPKNGRNYLAEWTIHEKSTSEPLMRKTREDRGYMLKRLNLTNCDYFWI